MEVRIKEMRPSGIGLTPFLSKREKQCNKCGFVTFSLHVLYNHRHKCRGKLLGHTITCSYCKRKFNYLLLYKTHKALCVKKTLRRKCLRIELKQKHVGYKPTKEPSFSCPICESSFETKQKFVSHLKKQNCKSSEKVKKPSLSARKSLVNRKTPKSSITTEVHHESLVSWPKKYSISIHDDELHCCLWCKSYYPSRDLLQKHLQMNYECAKALYRSNTQKRHSLTARKTLNTVARKSFPKKKQKMMMVEVFNQKKNSRSARKTLPSSKKTSKSRNKKSISNSIVFSFECPVCYNDFPDMYSFFQHQKMLNHWGKATKSMDTTLKCPFCGKEFMHASSRNVHVQNHKDISRDKIRAFLKKYTCSVCSQTFSTEQAKILHIKKQHPGSNAMKRYSESGSNTQSDSDYTLKDKMSFVPKSVKKKMKQQPNTCPVCSKSFSHTVNRNKHFNEVHLKIFECLVCNTKFKSVSSLNNHIKLSHNPDFACRACKIGFKDELQLLQHVLKSHPNKDPKLFLPAKLGNISPKEKEKEKTRVDLTSSSERLNYNSTSFGNLEYYCDVCNIGYLKLCGLQRHRQSKLHKDTLEKNLDAVQKSLSDLPTSPVSIPCVVKQPEILTCSECSEEFNSIKDFVPHRLSHFSFQGKYLRISELNPYMCEICSEVLYSHSKVQLHLFWHLQIESTAGSNINKNSSKKETIVPDRLSGQHVAKKSFSKQGGESLQEVVIAGVSKPLFTCENCNVGFTTKEHYNMHVRKLCKGKRVNETSNLFDVVPNIDSKTIELENNGVFHCITCNFIFSSSVKKDQHKPYCLKVDFDSQSDEYIKNLDAVKSALARDIAVSGCITCGALFDSLENMSHLSTHQDETDNSTTDDVPEDVLHCALCNCLFSLSAYKIHKDFCKIPIHIGDKVSNSKHMNVLKSALELKCALAGCISCGEPFDDLDNFERHLNLHQRNEIQNELQNVSICNGDETLLSVMDREIKNSTSDNPSEFLNSEVGENSLESDDHHTHDTSTSLNLSNSVSNIEMHKPSLDSDISSTIEDLRKNFSQLLCLLIADTELMETLGYGTLQVDDVLINVLEQMGQESCTDPKLSLLGKFRKNILTLLDLCLKDQIMQAIGKDKTTDEIVIEALNIFDA